MEVEVVFDTLCAVAAGEGIAITGTLQVSAVVTECVYVRMINVIIGAPTVNVCMIAVNLQVEGDAQIAQRLVIGGVLFVSTYCQSVTAGELKEPNLNVVGFACFEGDFAQIADNAFLSLVEVVRRAPPFVVTGAVHFEYEAVINLVGNQSEGYVLGSGHGTLPVQHIVVTVGSLQSVSCQTVTGHLEIGYRCGFGIGLVGPIHQIGQSGIESLHTVIAGIVFVLFPPHQPLISFAPSGSLGGHVIRGLSQTVNKGGFFSSTDCEGGSHTQNGRSCKKCCKKFFHIFLLK